jgi:hypothetical protein
VQWRDGLLNFISLLFFNQNFFSMHNLFRLLPLRVSVNYEKGYDTLLARWKNVRIFKVNLQARDGAVMCLHFVNFLNKISCDFFFIDSSNYQTTQNNCKETSKQNQQWLANEFPYVWYFKVGHDLQ